MAVKTKAAAPVAEVNFGDLGMYVGTSNFDLPEGDYILFFNVKMWRPKDKDGNEKGEQKLVVGVTAHNLEDPHNPEKTRDDLVYSMGSKAHLSFAPNAETGKSLVPVPGGPGNTLQPSSNWGIFLKWLYDAGLPPGVFTNDLTAIDGIHVHMNLIPEPEERKQMKSQAATGEAAADAQPQRDRRIAVVTEIKDDGKPWEGTGGLPEETAKPKAAAKPTAKPTAAAAPKAKAAAAVVEAEPVDDDLSAVATAAITPILEKNMNGIARLKLRTETFSALKKSAGEEVANNVINTYFSDDDALNAILGELGFSIQGAQVKPA